MTPLFLLLSAFGTLSSKAAVIVQTPGKISVEGIVNGSSGTPFSPSDSLDFLTFEVLSTTTVTMTITRSASSQLWIGRYIGLESEFEYLLTPEGNFLFPYSIVQTGSPPPFAALSVIVQPGTYVIAHGIANRMEDDNQVYEPEYGYLAVNPEGGGFTSGTYEFTVEGDIRGLEFRDGELNGTFIVTNLVPEPSAALLLVVGAGSALRRRRYAQ